MGDGEGGGWQREWWWYGVIFFMAWDRRKTGKSWEEQSCLQALHCYCMKSSTFFVLYQGIKNVATFLW